MTTRELLVSFWDIGFVVPLLSVGALSAYAWRFRGRLQARSLFFVAAVGLFFLALSSPIGVLARGYLFSAHMLQHLLLLLAVPPLAFLGMPRENESANVSERDTGAFGYVGPWLAGVGAMWIWHERLLCNAAAVSTPVQWFQTGSLIVMGLAFWRPILTPKHGERFAPFQGILYLFSACVACTVLGVLVTFSPVEVCSAYAHPADTLGALSLLRGGWGMSPKTDQELGGVMMWVPACFVYAAAILATLGRYYAEEGRETLAPATMKERR
jgi:cytochrome c oxidase assembly factor CtaG